MLDMTSTYKLKAGIVLKSINGKYWALSTLTGNQYRLNEVSYSIMNELTETKNIHELVYSLIKTYKVSTQEFTDDCSDFIKNALQGGLIEEVSI